MQRQALTLFLLIAVFIACASCIDVNLPDLPSTRFYVGGSFSSMKQADGTVVSANNIAYYFDGQWSAFGNGTNGDVRVIHMDLCRNVYAGGEFTTVDGVTTGYVAKYNVLKEQWEALASAGTLFGSSGVVHDISTDCVNIPSLQKKECNCDVYIAGQFTMNLGNGVTARNVAAYTAESASWSSMNSNEEFTVADTAYAIHKRYQTGVKDATKFVWVGGNFGLKSFDLSAKTWATHTTGTVVVKSIEYVIVPLFWKIDEVIIAGQFNFACDGGTCVNVASYDRDAKKFKPIGSSSVPTGIINSVSVTGGDVYVGGSFTSQNANNIAVLKEDASAYTSVSSSATPVATPVLKMNVCGYSNPLCKRGSFVVAAEGTTVSTGYLAFYDAESSSFVPMGNSTTVNGNVYALESAISSANLSAKAGILFVIASLLVTLFM